MATERIIRCRKSSSLADTEQGKRIEFQDKTGTWFVCAGGHDGEDHDWPREPEGGIPDNS